MRAGPGVFCLKPRGSPPSREGLGVMTEPAVNRTRLVPHLRRLPGGELHTLRDAATYITKLPKREHDRFAWRANEAVPTRARGNRAKIHRIVS